MSGPLSVTQRYALGERGGPSFSESVALRDRERESHNWTTEDSLESKVGKNFRLLPLRVLKSIKKKTALRNTCYFPAGKSVISVKNCDRGTATIFKSKVKFFTVQTYGEPFVPKLQMASVNLQSLVQNYQSLVLIHNR